MNAPTADTALIAEYVKHRFGPHDLRGFHVGVTAIRHGGQVENVSVPADDLDAITATVARYADDPGVMGVFDSQTLSRKPIRAGHRYTSADADALLSCWAEVDFGKPDAPPTLRDALRVVDAVGLPPTTIRHSGNGVHLSWALSEVWELTTDADRREAAELERDVVRTVAYRARELGLWQVDRVHDLARVLRTPGTLNMKNPDDPKLVTILSHEPGRVFEPDDVRAVLIERKYLDAMNVSSGVTDEQQRAVLARVNLHRAWQQARAGRAQELLELLAENGLDVKLRPIWDAAAASTVDDSSEDLRIGNSAFALFRSTGEDAALETAATFVMASRLRHGRRVEKVDPSRRVDYLTRTLALIAKPREDRTPAAVTKEGTGPMSVTVEPTTDTPAATDEALESLLASEPSTDDPALADAPKTQEKDVKKAKPPKRRKEADEAHEGSGGLPDVIMTGRPLRDTEADTRKFLALAQMEKPTIFHYADAGLVEIDPRTGEMVTIAPARLALLLNTLMNFRERSVEETDDGTKTVKLTHTPKVPFDIVAALHSAPGLIGVPELKRITRLPYFSEDGTLVTTPGYNRKTGIYLHRGPDSPLIPEVSAKPSPEELRVALELFTDDLLIDFPFETDADRTAAMTMPLTLLAREMIRGACPLFMIDTPRPGTGKGKLVSGLVKPFDPEFAFTIAPTGSDEWPKSLVAAMRKGRPTVAFDNINAALDSGALAAAVTEYPFVRNRLMGTHEEIVLPTPALWVGTGNSVTASSELARRIVRVRLDAKTAKPEERTGFKHPEILDWIEENTPQLIWAALTMIQSWIAAGRPIAADLPKFGSFEKWTRIVGSIAAHVGMPDFLKNRSAASADIDTETELIMTFCTIWAHDPGRDPIKDETGEIRDPGRPSCANRAVRVDELLELVDEYKLELPAQIGPQGTDRRSKFGTWLRKVIAAPVGPYSFTKTKPKNVAHYTLIDDGTGEFEEGGITVGDAPKPTGKHTPRANAPAEAKPKTEPVPESTGVTVGYDADEDSARWEALMNEEPAA
ncbi:hypothetical protein [Actinosynnema pretiosum]|uniref:Uncharacterized protein n=1 Tax=Actinosynnema pretiosum TaxID=42197 RepID=A0A290YZD5_9PSEU|nr:hypothetical protein [Actinosynnema pretiosum]ATE52110.1 hypothetical protein CNX65_01405 [Actinosynnema pretiosum]